MHNPPPQDTGIVRWYMFFPDTSLLAIPAWVKDPVAYGRNSGASLVRRENDVVWRREQTPTPSGTSRSYLAVVR